MSSTYDDSFDLSGFLLFLLIFGFGYLIIFSIFIPIAITTGNVPEYFILLPIIILPIYFYLRSKDDYK